MSRSLRSATMFPALTRDKTWHSLSDLQEEIDQPYPLTESLFGMPLAVSCQSEDTSTGARLKVLRPGMWLRLRDLHIEKIAQDVQYKSASSSSSSSSSENSTGAVDVSSSSAAVSVRKSGGHGDASGSTRTYMVGTVHPDTHISLLLPYFR
jgi:hypothetical protein